MGLTPHLLLVCFANFIEFRSFSSFCSGMVYVTSGLSVLGRSAGAHPEGLNGNDMLRCLF